MITSTSSSQVKHVISLLSKARERKKNKEYVVEGVRMVSEVPADLLVKIYMSERFHSNNPEYVHELVKKQGISSDSIEIVADNVFDRMSQTQTPQGIMAVVRMNDSSISCNSRRSRCASVSVMAAVFFSKSDCTGSQPPRLRAAIPPPAVSGAWQVPAGRETLENRSLPVPRHSL